MQELLQKVGVRMVVHHEGRLKAMFQPWREPTPGGGDEGQGIDGRILPWFVEAVASSRDMDVTRVREYATGEMFSAQKAAEMGLVDEIGDFDGGRARWSWRGWRRSRRSSGSSRGDRCWND